METNDEAIEAYDSLDGWKQELSSTGAMLTALDEAISKEDPIMVTAWSPHYMFPKWDIKYLEDPEGVYGEEESVITIIREGLKDDLPEAYEIINRIELDLEDVEQRLLDAQEMEFEDLAADWVQNNQDIVAECIAGVSQVNGHMIELVTTPWDDALFSSNVAKIVLEDQGYDVEVTPVDPAVLFEAVLSGSSDASLAPWIQVLMESFIINMKGNLKI